MKRLVCAIAMALCSCATTDDYWSQTGPAAVYQLEYVVDPAVIATRCDPEAHAYGCTFWVDSQTAVSYIRGRLPAALLQCVLTHEKQHRLGRAHKDRKLSYVDCGDGTFVTP